MLKLVSVGAAALVSISEASVRVHEEPTHEDVMALMTERLDADTCALYDACPENVDDGISSGSNVGLNVASSSSTPMYPCSNGKSANTYPCSNMDMYSHVPLSDLGGAGLFGNDIWGWTSDDGTEYALAGLNDGTSVVDISNPNSPNVVAFIESHTSTRTYWRDMKIYGDWVYIVQDGTYGHGLQYVNLPNLIARASSTSGIFKLSSSDSDNKQENTISKCHNVFVNEDTGYLYAVGTDIASGGLVFYDVSDPGNPKYAGSWEDDGYTHDVECVVYNGPDSEHVGKEICFAYNEDAVTIVDVSNKDNPKELSSTGYSNSKYTHQGWIDESHTYIFLDDELDEMYLGLDKTTTFVFDVSNLDSPSLINNGPYKSSTHGSIDHNHYVLGNYLYQGHYRAGVRVLDISNPSSLSEIGYFDTYPTDDAAQFDGVWSVFPYFDSGIIVAQDTIKGLFVLKFSDDDNDNESPVPSPTEAPTCNSNQFECDDGCCIKKWYYDDNWCDCGNCEDEPEWTCDECAGGVCGEINQNCDGSYKYCVTTNNKEDGSSSGSSKSSSNNNNNGDNEIWSSGGFIAGMCVLALVIIVVGISCVVYRKRKMANQVSYSNNDNKDYVPPTNTAAETAKADEETPDVRVY